MGGPRSSLDVSEKRKTYCPCWDSNPGLKIQIRILNKFKTLVFPELRWIAAEIRGLTVTVGRAAAHILSLSLSLSLSTYIHRVSQEEFARFWVSVPYVKVYRYNSKHLYPKLNGYGDNGQRKVRCSADALRVHCACP